MIVLKYAYGKSKECTSLNKVIKTKKMRIFKGIIHGMTKCIIFVLISALVKLPKTGFFPTLNRIPYSAGDALSGMVIVDRNENGDLSSNPGRSCLCFSLR